VNREQLIHHHFNELHKLLQEEADDMKGTIKGCAQLMLLADQVDAAHHDYAEAAHVS